MLRTLLLPKLSLRNHHNQIRRMSTMDYASLKKFGEEHINGGVGRITDGVMVRGKGSWVEYGDGKKMLDFTCGIGVTNLGHANERVSRAAADQCMQLVHSQCSIAMHEPYLRLISKLLPIMPHPSLDSFFFWNSGSEAVEAAIKMARSLTGKQNVISCQGAYHGRTFGAMAVTRSKTVYSEGVMPLMPGVYTMPYPYWHQFNLPPDTPTDHLTTQSLYQLELLLSQQSSPSDTAAIIIEPVLGEGGYVPTSPSFLQNLRKICDKHKILLIIDEVQSGFGRTGRMFAIEESGVRPDILLMAKGLGNGFPISGVVCRKGESDKLKKGSMGGTYAGNVVSCAAASMVVDVFREENVLDNVAVRSEELFSYLKALRSEPEIAPHILDIRGKGLMVGVEFASPSGPTNSEHDVNTKPNAPKDIASRVAKKCIEKGMLILTTSVYQVVRFIPPLNISKEDMKLGCEIFGEAVKEVVREG